LVYNNNNYISDYHKFDEIISLKQMSNDYRTIKNLFEALTQETNSSTTGISFV
jgi:hypothetical protein